MALRILSYFGIFIIGGCFGMLITALMVASHDDRADEPTTYDTTTDDEVQPTVRQQDLWLIRDAYEKWVHEYAPDNWDITNNFNVISWLYKAGYFK